jgi:hypothetical protein
MYKIGLDGRYKWVCDVCERPIDNRNGGDWRGRLRHYCSNPCRQKAYRRRKFGQSPEREKSKPAPLQKNVDLGGINEAQAENDAGANCSNQELAAHEVHAVRTG